MVFVLDTNKKPLDMCHPAKARRLLKTGKAAVYRKHPFTIILKRSVEDSVEKAYRLKVDYGSKHTGLALLKDDNVEWLCVLDHRTNIKDLLDKRRGYRRRRRNANLRYRVPRFNNRTRKEGWLPPSLQSRVDNIFSWTKKINRLVPLGYISYENVKFDTQKMQDNSIAGIEYQQGTLYGYEVWEYLLEKFNRKCAYCGVSGIPLEIEHIIPKSRGGSNRISNLAIACHDCNQKKGSLTAAEVGHPEVGQQAKKPLKDAAMVTATRWTVLNKLKQFDIPVECGTGGLTKYNRINIGLPKEHYYDACCVGKSTPNRLHFKTNGFLVIKARGRGQHCRTNVNASGFPQGYLARQKRFFGFQTGDAVIANVPKGKKQGVYTGVVLCRKSGSFDIKTKSGRIQGISHKYIHPVQHTDGYTYFTERRSAASSPCLKAGASAV